MIQNMYFRVLDSTSSVSVLFWFRIGFLFEYVYHTYMLAHCMWYIQIAVFRWINV